MNFCPYCESIMGKSTTPTGVIEFKCVCGYDTPGNPEDTLMDEGDLSTGKSLLHDDFIENSPFDPARNLVEKSCPKCNRGFLTLIRIGVNETTMYTCECGFKSTHSEYVKNSAVTK